MTITKIRRIAWIIGVLVLGLPVVGRTAPLEYRITSKLDPSTMTLHVDRTLTNISDRPVIIDANGLGYMLIIEEIPHRVGRNGMSGTSALTAKGDPGPGYTGKYVALMPGQSYQARRDLPLRRLSLTHHRSYLLSFMYGYFLDDRAWKGSVYSDKLRFRFD